MLHISRLAIASKVSFTDDLIRPNFYTRSFVREMKKKFFSGAKETFWAMFVNQFCDLCGESWNIKMLFSRSTSDNSLSYDPKFGAGFRETHLLGHIHSTHFLGIKPRAGGRVCEPGLGQCAGRPGLLGTLWG